MDVENPDWPRLPQGLVWEDGSPATLHCPACDSASPCPRILSVANLRQPSQLLTLHACPSCQSHFYDPTPDTNYLEAYIGPAAHYHLLQGVSLEFPLGALSALKLKGGRLLDVGCGPGFVVDLWERLGFDSAVGIEPSHVGDFARNDLHRLIRAVHLQDDAETPDHAFDVVLSTEVLEHVSSPESFLRTISKKVAPDGMLIFSTPNIGNLGAGQTSASNLIEALSPGYHVTLFSEGALRNILAKLGISHVQLIDYEGHWLVYASHKPFKLEMDAPWAEQTHRKYLEHASRDKSISPRAQTVFAYRLFRKAANEGDWPQTDALLPDILELLPPETRPWLQPGAIIHADQLSDNHLRVWMGDYFHLPALFFQLGIRAKNHLKEIAPAIQFFQLAARLARLTILHLLDDAYTKEIYWVSQLNAGVAFLESGNEIAGMKILDEVAISLEHAENYLLPQSKFATRARLEIFRHQVQTGQWQAASLTLPALQGYLSSLYPPAFLRASGWFDPNTPWPEEWDPFWYFYCESMLALNLGHHAAAADGFTGLHALCKSKMALSSARHFLPLSEKHAKLARQQKRSSGKFSNFFQRLQTLLTSDTTRTRSC